jgi:hypothetical protein
MAVASYLQCKSSPGVSRGFAILGSRLGQFKFLKTTHNPSINRTVKKLRLLTAGYVKRRGCRKSPVRKMLAIELDLRDDHVNSEVVDHLSNDLLVERFSDSGSGIFRGDLKNTISFCEVRKILAKRVFLHLRYAT